MYQNYIVKNVTIDHNSFLTSSRGLVKEIVCSRALTSEIPLEINNVCIKQKITLPVASQVFDLANTSFILVKKGTLHCVCQNLPPVTLELKMDINLLYTSKGCRVQILFPDGLTWISEGQDTQYRGFQPILVIHYDLIRESTKLEIVTFWHTVNSFGVLFLILLLATIILGIYCLQKFYKLEILRGPEKTKIQVFERDILPTTTEISLNTVDGIYRKKDFKHSDSTHKVVNYASTDSSCDRITILGDHPCTASNTDEICVLDKCETHQNYDADSDLSSVQKLGRKPASHQ